MELRTRGDERSCDPGSRGHAFSGGSTDGRVLKATARSAGVKGPFSLLVVHWRC